MFEYRCSIIAVGTFICVFDKYWTIYKADSLNRSRIWLDQTWIRAMLCTWLTGVVPSPVLYLVWQRYAHSQYRVQNHAGQKMGEFGSL